MNKKELLNYLSEKKRLTAPVAMAQENADQAELNYDKSLKKWKGGIIVLFVIFVFYVLVGLLLGRDMNLIYFDKYEQLQIGGLGGTLLFGGLLSLLLYVRQILYVKPAEDNIAEALHILAQEKNNPDYKNGAKNFPSKFYNYYDLYYLWNFINEGRADDLKEAYNLLETQQFQQDQMAIQADIRRLQQEAATTSKVNAAASVITAYNTAKAASRLKK